MSIFYISLLCDCQLCGLVVGLAISLDPGLGAFHDVSLGGVTLGFGLLAFLLRKGREFLHAGTPFLDLSIDFQGFGLDHLDGGLRLAQSAFDRHWIKLEK